MTKTVTVDLEAIEIGRRARRIRRRRGLSLDVVAGLARITKGYLSMLESGQRGFNRRGLIEDLAGALGCSVTDLTGQPYLPVNRDTADTLATVPGIQMALHNYDPDDVPDVRPRSPRSACSTTWWRCWTATRSNTAILRCWTPCLPHSWTATWRTCAPAWP